MTYLSRKIEQAHIVWFQASNQWVQFDEQQWLIFCFYNEGLSGKEAAEKLCETSALTKTQAKKIVDSLYNSIGNLFNPSFKLPNFSATNPEIREYSLPKKKTRHYSYPNKPFSITYGSPFLEQYIHIPLAQLEVESDVSNALHFEVFKFNHSYILRENWEGGECLGAEEPGQIKRLLYIALSNLFYGKENEQWLTFIHGSAVIRNNKLLVLTSSGGSGKSTMAGLLLNHGFEFYSDDFLPVDTQTRKAYPIPAAICIKNNAIDLLEDEGLKFYHKSPKNLAYLDVLTTKTYKNGLSIGNVVFINYTKGADVSLTKISPLEALQPFFQEAWVGDDMQRAEIFVDWFTTLIFYKLEYGNTPKAIEALKNLMDKSE